MHGLGKSNKTIDTVSAELKALLTQLFQIVGKKTPIIADEQIQFTTLIAAIKTLPKEDASRENVDIPNETGGSALTHASFHGHAACVMPLVAAGADPNYINPKNGSSVLIYASFHGHAACVTSLLAAGADPNYVNPITGGSALILASQNGHAAAWWVAFLKEISVWHTKPALERKPIMFELVAIAKSQKIQSPFIFSAAVIKQELLRRFAAKLNKNNNVVDMLTTVADTKAAPFHKVETDFLTMLNFAIDRDGIKTALKYYFDERNKITNRIWMNGPTRTELKDLNELISASSTNDRIENTPAPGPAASAPPFALDQKDHKREYSPPAPSNKTATAAAASVAPNAPEYAPPLPNPIQFSAPVAQQPAAAVTAIPLANAAAAAQANVQASAAVRALSISNSPVFSPTPTASAAPKASVLLPIETVLPSNRKILAG